MCDLRIVILGKDVGENRRTGNSILREHVHQGDPYIYLLRNNVMECSSVVRNRHITVLITLHLLNPDTTDHQISQTVRECASLSDPGPHAFILVLQHENLTEADMRRIIYVLKAFSEDAPKHTLIIMTDEVRQKSLTALFQLANACCGEFWQPLLRKPVPSKEIIHRVDMLIKDSPENYVTCEVYEDAKEFSEEEEQSRSLDSSRSDEENKHYSHNKDDGKSKQSRRQCETLRRLCHVTHRCYQIQ